MCLTLKLSNVIRKFKQHAFFVTKDIYYHLTLHHATSIVQLDIILTFQIQNRQSIPKVVMLVIALAAHAFLQVLVQNVHLAKKAIIYI